MAPPNRLHLDLASLLEQHGSFRDQRHLMMLARMVAGSLLSQTLCCDRWKTALPLDRSLATSWQRRCQRWFSNDRIEIAAIYEPLCLWFLQHWQKPDQTLHLVLDTTVLGNRCRVVMLSAVCQGQAIPLLWRTLEHPSADESAELVLALLQRSDRLLEEFESITLLAEPGVATPDLLAWFAGASRWRYVLPVQADTWIRGSAAPLGCALRELPLARGDCRGFRDVQIWGEGEGARIANLLLAFPADPAVEQPWYLVSNLDPDLDLVSIVDLNGWRCEPLLRDHRSGIFQLPSNRLRDAMHIDRLLMVEAISLLVNRLESEASRQIDPQGQAEPRWQQGLSFLRLGKQLRPRHGIQLEAAKVEVA